MEIPPVKKRKVKLSHENIFTFKNERSWELNSLALDKKLEKTEYNIEMDATTVFKICK